MKPIRRMRFCFTDKIEMELKKSFHSDSLDKVNNLLFWPFISAHINSNKFIIQDSITDYETY